MREVVVDAAGQMVRPDLGPRRRRVPEMMDLKNPVLLGPVQNQEHHMNGVVAIACMTASGYTPLIASRIRSGLPIVGLAHNPIAQRRMALYRGVVSLPFDTSQMTATELNDQALTLLVKQGVAKPGDHVILTRGDHMNAHGGTNTMKVMAITEQHAENAKA